MPIRSNEELLFKRFIQYSYNYNNYKLLPTVLLMLEKYVDMKLYARSTDKTGIYIV